MLASAVSRWVRRVALGVAVTVAVLGASTMARAHGLEFGVLRIEERPGGAYARLRMESTGASAVGLQLSGGGSAPSHGCTTGDEVREVDADGRLVIGAALDCPDGIDGVRVGVTGLGEQQVLLIVERLDGTEVHATLDAAEPTWLIEGSPSFGATVVRYLEIGAGHVAEGLDHLLFLFALLLVVLSARVDHRARIRLLLGTVTGFTLGHAVTITVAGLGLASLPSAPVELSIALSIVWLAAELIREADPPSLTRRFPWAVAAGFGLLHGLGFAGALREIGVTPGRAIASLLGFNLGVELAQMGFVAVMYAAAALSGVDRHEPRRRVMAYAIGVVAVVFAVTRVDALTGG